MRVTVTDSPHAEAPNEGPREDSNEMPNEKCSGIKSCACGATFHKGKLLERPVDITPEISDAEPSNAGSEVA